MLLSNANAKLANPLRNIPYDQLMRDVDVFAEEHGEPYVIFQRRLEFLSLEIL